MRWVVPFLVAAALIALLAVWDFSPRRGVVEGRPVEASTDRLRRGRTVFMQTCHPCHPNGGPGLGPGLNSRWMPGWLIRAQVRLGLGAMPAIGEDRVSGDDLSAAIDYIQEMRDS